MGVGVVRGVTAPGFEHVLEVVGDEVEGHEQEEDGHRKASKDFGALEAVDFGLALNCHREWFECRVTYPKGWRMLDRFHTSKLQNTSTPTQIVALIASKKMRCERAVMASEPCALQRTYAATRAWHRHHPKRVVCSLDMLLHASLNVGTGREAGIARGALGGGSRKI